MPRLLWALLLVSSAPGVSPAFDQDGQNWFNRGLAQHREGAYDEAIASFQHALDAGFNPPGAMMRIGRAWAKKGDLDKAIDWIDKSAKAGFSIPSAIAGDADLALVRADARFAPILARITDNSTPCEHSAGFRAFDFWVGTWDVMTAAGKAQSVIEKVLGGCVIMENWYGPPTGKSMNLYDPATSRWRQIWADDQGNVNEYQGEIRDGAMHYSRTFERGGQKVLARMTFTPQEGGRVRQLIEQSTDGGKTWTSQFDGMYVPAKRSF
jgi:tetratricopeptide (TPR) repeat protein